MTPKNETPRPDVGQETGQIEQETKHSNHTAPRLDPLVGWFALGKDVKPKQPFRRSGSKARRL